MVKNTVTTIELNFQGRPQTVASYLIRHSTGAVLVECGPGSTLSALEAGLAKEGLSPRDVTHVLLTHIHLDHAGAAGWFSRLGAQIIVHPFGAPHMVDPSKLIASATRIYKDRMQTLWGEFLPVAENQLKVPRDAEEIIIGSLRFIAIDAPGHANHHYCYLFEDICFTGDVGGVRIPGHSYIRLPMPPPELHFGKWRRTLARLRKEKISYIAPTHFGIFDDPEWHLCELERELDAIEKWLDTAMQFNLSVDELHVQFLDWMKGRINMLGLKEEMVNAYDLANPLGISAGGLHRYWKRVHMDG